MTEAVINAAFTDLEKTKRIFDEIFDDAMYAIRQAYEDTESDVAIFHNRVSVRIANKKYFWSQDVITVDGDYEKDWRTEEPLPARIKYRHGSGGENEGFSAPELLAYKAEVFTTAAKIATTMAVQEDYIRELMVEYEEKKSLAYRLSSEKEQAEKDKKEVKTRKEVAKITNLLQPVKDFDALVNQWEKQELWRVKAVSFEINGESFKPIFTEFTRENWGRTRYEIDGTRTSKKNIQAELARTDYYVNEMDIKNHVLSRMHRMSFTDMTGYVQHIEELKEKYNG